MSELLKTYHCDGDGMCIDPRCPRHSPPEMRAIARSESTPLPRGAMNVAFLLTMPNNNAWNGKWTGEGKCYARVRAYSARDLKERMGRLVGNHYYNFGDGWGANVQVKIVTPEEKRKLLKATAGFCGYEWMIDSLIQHGRIQA
jgi:hypothetical protein